jgi:NOL1/NOP2/fmu family ribosome biogenesis protein
LFRRDPNAMAEWSPEAVERCWRRQQRILADVWPALKEGGLLIYATCSYSPQENEDIVDWLCQHVEACALPLALPEGAGITAAFSPLLQQPCYRFYPHLAKGEGFFLAVLRKNEAAPPPAHYRPPKPAKEAIPVAELQQYWTITHPALRFYRHKDVLYAMPEQVHAFFLQWQKTLHIRKAGVCMGQWLHHSLQPDHALAMSGLLHPAIQRIPLSLADAQQYLRKDNSMAIAAQKGWGLATFEGVPLGWLKHLGNRFNNYYPKEWRLRS